MTKILFIHNTAMWYRRPFFKRLSEIYDVKFVFTHIQVCKDIYGVEISDEIEGLEGVNYKTLKNYFNFIKPHGIAFGVIEEAMGDYEVLVGGSWDSLAEIIETSFYFTIAKLRRKPFVIYYGKWDWAEKSLKRKLINPWVKYLVKHSDGIVTYGTKSKEYFIKLGADPNRVFRAFNTNIIDTTVNRKEVEDLKNRLKIENKKKILYVGRLEKRKNADILIKSFYKLKQDHNETCLVIIGDGECKNEFQALCKELNIENDVLFLGMIENKELPPYYSLCNIFVLPASGEPWGLVLNEAMQFGKPVIATDGVGAAYDLIEDGENGFRVPEKDSDALYNAMKKIISNPELEKKMGEESKRIIEGFTYETMADGFRKALNYVIK